MRQTADDTASRWPNATVEMLERQASALAQQLAAARDEIARLSRRSCFYCQRGEGEEHREECPVSQVIRERDGAQEAAETYWEAWQDAAVYWKEKVAGLEAERDLWKERYCRVVRK